METFCPLKNKIVYDMVCSVSPFFHSSPVSSLPWGILVNHHFLKDPEVAAGNPRSRSALWSGEVVALWKEVQTRLENRY